MPVTRAAPAARPRRRRFPVWIHAVLAVAVLLIAGTAVAVTATGSAAPQSRRVEPFMAGTMLRNGTRGCTAGLVLKDNSTLGGLTEYRRSVRFILTAGHCGEVADKFTTPGRSVGTAIWKSSTHDFMLIKVEPRLDFGVAPGCQPGSSNLPCVAISSHYYPRAVGRVFTGAAGVSDSAPVNGTTMSGGLIFISGAVGGTVGGHWSVPRPEDMPPDAPDAQDLSYTRHAGNITRDGDSGAPLFSHNGNVFGILKGTWGRMVRGVEVHYGAQYTKVSVFFAEQSGYALAPPE